MLASASEDHFIDIAEVETGNGTARRDVGGEVLVELGGHWENQSAKGEPGYVEQSAVRGSLCLDSLWRACVPCLSLATR